MYNNPTAEKANKDRLSDRSFQDTCLAVGIPATKRQASKYNNKYGKAYKYDTQQRVLNSQEEN